MRTLGTSCRPMCAQSTIWQRIIDEAFVFTITNQHYNWPKLYVRLCTTHFHFSLLTVSLKWNIHNKLWHKTVLTHKTIRRHYSFLTRRKNCRPTLFSYWKPILLRIVCLIYQLHNICGIIPCVPDFILLERFNKTTHVSWKIKQNLHNACLANATFQCNLKDNNGNTKRLSADGSVATTVQRIGKSRPSRH